MSYQINAIDFLPFRVTGWIPARLVLYFLSWSGFLVSFMMRNDINIALVSMVKNNNKNDTILQSTVNASLNASDTKVPIAVDNGEFDWSSSVQSVILGSFYAFYVLSQVSFRVFFLLSILFVFISIPHLNVKVKIRLNLIKIALLCIKLNGFSESVSQSHLKKWHKILSGFH